MLSQAQVENELDGMAFIYSIQVFTSNVSTELALALILMPAFVSNLFNANVNATQLLQLVYL